MKALFDSNILIDYLNGVNAARTELKKYSNKAISIISWMEVMIGVESEEEEGVVRPFLETFLVQPLTQEIAERSVKLRRRDRLKLPDAIIKASAEELGILFVTRNAKDFSKRDPAVRIPY